MRRIVVFVSLALVAGCVRHESPSAATPKQSESPAVAEQAAGTDVGDRMPAYSAKTLDGKPFDLAAEKGSVVFLNVWATWCGPCRYEIPQLQALHARYVSHGFKVIGISVDEGGADGVAQFVKDSKMTYPVVLDPDGRIANVLRTTVLPTSVIIGRDGRILWRSVGAVEPNDLPKVDVIIQQALGK